MFLDPKVKILLDYRVFFNDYGKFVKTTSVVNECRDKKDNFPLDLSVTGRTVFLITGDKGLLISKKVKNTEIITSTEFINFFDQPFSTFRKASHFLLTFCKHLIAFFTTFAEDKFQDEIYLNYFVLKNIKQT